MRLTPTVVALALLFVGILVWVGCVAYVFMDASARSMRNPGWWALGTLLGGPFALIAFLVDRPKTSKMTCPHCRNEILATDNVCPFCGWVNCG